MKTRFPSSVSAALLLFAATFTAPAFAQTSNYLSGPGPTFTVPASEIPTRWSVIAYGDPRFTDPTNIKDTNPTMRRALVNQIASEHPDALILTGDLPLNGSVANDYKVFQDETAIWRTNNLRFFPVLGNHELRGGDEVGLANWWAAFPQLNHRRWYSVSFGSAYFILLDSDQPLIAGSVQQQWVADQFAHLPTAVRYVFVSFHHPAVSDDTSGSTHMTRPNEAEFGEYLQSVAPKLPVKIVVISAHIHNYSRFERGGVVFLISGGAGAKTYAVTRSADDLYKNPADVNYHYIRFDFDGKQVNAVMHRVSEGPDGKILWETRDSFTLVPPVVAKTKKK